jgi:hypothetical protein
MIIVKTLRKVVHIFSYCCLGRQGGGLEEQLNDVLLQGLCDNGRSSEDIAELSWLHEIL